jgi:Transport and Golgi organisation 2
MTSNRDENVQRQNAAAPAFHEINNKRIIFPKDAKAGGTWFAASDTGTVAILLNGAFVKHIPAPPYRKSRGLVLLDIIGAGDPFDHFNEIDLFQIEPFTLVLFQNPHLYELRWDEKRKYVKQLNTHEFHIWSSATLYTAEAVAERERIFRHFVQDENHLQPAKIHDMHNSDHGDPENGFVIDRESGLKTFSITQAVIGEGRIDFRHDDLLHNRQFHETMNIPVTAQ